MQGLRPVVKPIWKWILAGGFTLILLIMGAYYGQKLVFWLQNRRIDRELEAQKQYELYT